MYRAFPGSDYYADSATPRLRQPASGLAGPPPAARRLWGASHVHCDPFDRVGSRLYPCSASEKHSQPLHGHLAPLVRGPERPAVFKGHGRCCVQPMSARFGAGLRMKGLPSPLCFRSTFRSRLHARGRLAVPPGRHVVGAASTARCAIPHHGCPQLHRAAASAQGRRRGRHG
jgi:hypothetical protein